MSFRLLVTLVLVMATSLVNADIGDGVKAWQKGDYKTAFTEWESIAINGDPIAQYNLGMLYARGEGVIGDMRQAWYWFIKSADQGYSESQSVLATMYRFGDGVERHIPSAIRWYTKAAMQGHAISQLNLGLMYWDDENVVRDVSKAKYWIREAHENDNTEVREAASQAWTMFELWKY